MNNTDTVETTGIQLSGDTNALTNSGTLRSSGAISLSGTADSMVNTGTLEATSITLNCDTASVVNTGVLSSDVSLNAVSNELINSGTLEASSISLTGTTNLIKVTAGSLTTANTVTLQSTAATGGGPSVGGSNQLVIENAGAATGGSFSGGVQFLASSATNTISITNSDVTFTNPALGWGNKTGDTFTVVKSRLVAPSGIELGGATGGGMFKPSGSSFSGDVTMRNIGLVCDFDTDISSPLLHFTDHAHFDGVTIYSLASGLSSSLVGGLYGDMSGLITAGLLTVGDNGIMVAAGEAAPGSMTARSAF